MRMPFTFAILTTILIYTWILEPRGVPVTVPGVIVVVLAAWSGFRSGEWGLSPKALVPAFRATARFTIPSVLVVLGIGAALGTLHDRGSLLRNLAVLIPWGASQQWVLQTVVLREVRQIASPRKSIVIAALLFALVHLPNPLLTLMTFVGALGWCAIYARYPSVVPLAISHAIATLALLFAFDDDLTGRLRIGHAYLMLDR
jgi:membrane protease YdiL (CAAX protease family)